MTCIGVPTSGIQVLLEISMAVDDNKIKKCFKNNLDSKYQATNIFNQGDAMNFFDELVTLFEFEELPLVAVV